MITCCICGKKFLQLNGHLKKHNITPAEYCKKYNVDSTVSDESKSKIKSATKQGMNASVKQHLKDVWLSDKRREFLNRRSIAMRGNVPGNRLTNEQFIAKLEDKFPGKFKLLSDYTGSSKPVKLHCSTCNSDIEKRPNYIYAYGCPVCSKADKKPRINTWNKVSCETFKERFERKLPDYELLSDYTKAEDKIHVRHKSCGHSWWVNASQIYSAGSGCPACAKKTSGVELDLRSFVKSIFKGKVLCNVRNVIPPYELDIYIPEKNVAFEFNGTYWHSTLCEEKDYHYRKSKLCEEQGIRLIHVWEYEWLDDRKRPILENIITSALGSICEKIYARKCNIVVKPSKDMKDFFNTNNIQGFRSGKFSICLEYNGETVMAYQMGSAFFGKGKYEWEVIRGATKIGTTVVGGASRIWNYFVENYKPHSCVYYVDYNYFNGNSVEKLGFKYVVSQPSFKNYWVSDSTIRNRDPRRHAEVLELEKQGLVIPIYNAGTKVYIYEHS